ncbi:hypothetical protein D9M68_18900 [compost metagenome]
MTDRHAAYIVVLDENIREDDAQAIITALEMVKGVATVQPVVGNSDQQIATARVYASFKTQLVNFILNMGKDNGS